MEVVISQGMATFLNRVVKAGQSGLELYQFAS